MSNEASRGLTLKLACCICKKPIPEENREYAELPENHPGILGPVHPECYDRACEESPDLPWEDPISGEVDYDEMAEDLGVDEGEDEGSEWEEQG